MSHPSTALITGATGGIGRALAEEFARRGFNIALACHDNIEKNRSLAAALESAYSIKAVPVCGDLSSSDEALQIVRKTNESLGAVSLLINNSGVRSDKVFVLSNQKDWWHVIQTNLGSVVNVCRAVIPGMLRTGSGSIVNVTSLSGHRGTFGQTAYAASKGAITAFSKSLARELASKKIRVNCVAPGLIDTPMIADLPQQVLEGYIKNNPQQRIGRPEEVAAAVAFVACDATHMVGQTLHVDGGSWMA